MPEKVLGTTEAWAQRHPRTMTAVDQGADRSLRLARRADQPRRCRPCAGEPALCQRPGRDHRAVARDAGLPHLPSRSRQLSLAQPCRLVRGANGALGSSPVPTSMRARSPTASPAPIPIARLRVAMGIDCPTRRSQTGGSTRRTGRSAGHGSASCQGQRREGSLEASNLGSASDMTTRKSRIRNRSERDPLAGAAVVPCARSQPPGAPVPKRSRSRRTN